MAKSLVMQNDRGDYLFYEPNNNDTSVFFTVTDKNGNVIRSAELPLSLECFVKSMEKAGYRKECGCIHVFL